MQEPRFVPGLSAFVDRYEAFIIDQWGVLHDGAKPYPGAVETVAELHGGTSASCSCRTPAGA